MARGSEMNFGSYTRFKLRHGIRWNTGANKFDWSLVWDCIVAVIVSTCVIYALYAVIDAMAAQDELAHVRTILETREKQITACLNGRSIGTIYDHELKRDVAVACKPAEIIDFGGFK